MIMSLQRNVRRKVAVAVLCVGLLAGTTAPAGAIATDTASRPEPDAAPQCEHPYPCGDEWPANVPGEGALELRSVDSITIESFDGTMLDGWVARPELPDSVKAPAIILSSPYLGTCMYAGCFTTPDNPEWWGDAPPAEAVDDLFETPPIRLIERGYALVFVSVRGTGSSGGCFEFWGPNEQQDQVEIVKWTAEQEWSNGRVAFSGLSYPSGTAWSAAVKAAEQGVDALKTTITSGLVTDVYTGEHTLQGAKKFWTLSVIYLIVPGVTFAPPAGTYASDVLASLTDPGSATLTPEDWIALLPERVCDDVLAVLTHDLPGAGDQHATFYESRRLIDGFPEVTAASLIAHGFNDGGMHATQEDEVWRSLRRSPKWQIEGNWGHTFPNDNRAGPPSIEGVAWWHDAVYAWLDYWLKGRGTPLRVDVVDYQDADGTWHEAGAWPPNRRSEALHLAGERLSPDPASDESARSFVSAPDPRSQEILFTTGPSPFAELAGPLSLCRDGSQTSLRFDGDIIEEPVLLAGNPFAHLRVSSDQPAGLLSADVAILSPEFACDANGIPHGARFIASGTADLERHNGSYVARPFPVGVETHVRIDLGSVHHLLQPGERLALVVSRGDLTSYATAQGGYPTITVLGGDDGSQLVLPLVKGTLGGPKAKGPYSPKPFVPR